MEKKAYVGYKIRLLHNELHKRMEYNKKKTEEQTGDLTRMQRFTIGYLYFNKEKDIYQKDIENEFKISRATASNMLAVMERKGLIYKEAVAHDARLKKIVLTEQAKQMNRSIECAIYDMEELLTQGMSEDDKQRLHRYLDLMIQNIVEEHPGCTTISCTEEQK